MGASRRRRWIFDVQLIGKYFANGGRMLWTPNLPYRIPATVLQILPLVANLWGCRWDKFVLFIFYFRLLFTLFVLFQVLMPACLSLLSIVWNKCARHAGSEQCFRPALFWRHHTRLESNFWVVTACGRSYFVIGLCRLHLAPNEGQEVVRLWKLLWRPWTPVGAISGRFPGTCGCVSRKGGVVLAVRRHVGRIRQQHGRECWDSNWWYFCSRGGS